METPNYKVSPQTAGIVSAYDLLSKVYDKVYESLNLIYDEKTALEVIDRDFMPGLHSLEDAIFRLVALSIKERRGDIGNDEI